MAGSCMSWLCDPTRKSDGERLIGIVYARRMKRLCLFCGSAPGRSTEFAKHAKELAEVLAQRGIGLVYGGANRGLMTVAADAALAAGVEVVGVIPTVLADKEVAHTGLTQLVQVSSLAERKDKMAELSDAFITLPGGLGTLDELFEMLTWNVLDLQDKPCGIVNTNGYYDGLLAFLDRAVEQGLIRAPARHSIIVGPEPISVVNQLSAAW